MAKCQFLSEVTFRPTERKRKWQNVCGFVPDRLEMSAVGLWRVFSPPVSPFSNRFEPTKHPAMMPNKTCSRLRIPVTLTLLTSPHSSSRPLDSPLSFPGARFRLASPLLSPRGRASSCDARPAFLFASARSLLPLHLSFSAPCRNQ